MIELVDLPVVNAQSLVRILSDVSLVGWFARMRIEGPTMTDVRAPVLVVGPDNLAAIKAAPSLIGRPYELLLLDPTGRAHLLGTGNVVAGVLAIPTDYTYLSTDPESIPGGGTGGGGGGIENLIIDQANPEPVTVNSLWIELNPDNSPKTAWIVLP